MSDGTIKFLSGVAVLVGSALVFGAAESSGIFSATTASWVQAIGSVAVVGAAAWIAGAQSREAAQRERRLLEIQEQAREEARRESCAIAAALLLQAQIRMKSIADSARAEKAPAISPFMLKALHTACEAISKFQIHTLRSPFLIDRFSRAEAAVHMTIEYIEGQRRFAEAHANAGKGSLIDFADRLDEAVERLGVVIETIRAATPAP